MFLEAGKPYPFEDYFLEWGGRDFTQIGLIYHGKDPVYNLDHSPVKGDLSYYMWRVDNKMLQV